MLNRRLLKNVDYTFLFVICLILGLSLLILSSATANIGTDPLFYVKKQILWIGLGIVGALVMLSFDYTKLLRFDYVIYGLVILSLVAVLLIGHASHGAQQWISLGPFLLQPSEFGKILMVICFASFLVKRQGELRRFRDLLPCFLYFSFPLLLVLAQPDLGTSLVFIAILFGMLYLAGARPVLLLGLLGGGLAAVAIALALHFSPLHLPLPLQDYQIARLVVFLDPYRDPQGHGYHIIQSLVAIGSGWFWGKGLYNGSQVQLNFLPEHHTDFIFSVVGEELGFLGASLLLFLYFNLLSRALQAAFQARDLFGRLLIGGILSMWLFHILENIGMTIGLMPVTGIPLPFLSYGGSFMLTNMIAVGLILNVHLRREKMLF
ncbi:MAG: rod shape-determining protein RodA [Bacillota bacterium]|nr:rod shape-determining protein RodA [Bacillota bacterium]